MQLLPPHRHAARLLRVSRKVGFGKALGPGELSTILPGFGWYFFFHNFFVYLQF